MTASIAPPENAILAELKLLRAQVNTLRSAPYSYQDQRYQRIRTKAVTPSDADYTAATMPPIGATVIDTTANKIWVRTAVATWKSAAVV